MPNIFSSLSKVIFNFMVLYSVCFMSNVALAIPVFINEIHYDNAGSDLNEGFEIAGPASTNLNGWQLVLYNGSNGQPYSSISLDGFLPELSNGFGALSFLSSGLQNGAPDGVALVNNLDEVIQFLSYEGVVSATAGVASGLDSINIQVQETPSTVVGTSLQLFGSGSSYTDFQWASGVGQSFGAINAGQSFSAVTSPPIVAAVPVPNTFLLSLFVLMLMRPARKCSMRRPSCERLRREALGKKDGLLGSL